MATVHIKDQEVVSLLKHYDFLESPGKMDAWLLTYLKVHQFIRETLKGEQSPKPIEAVLTSAFSDAINVEIGKMKDDVSNHVSGLQRSYSDTLEKIQTAWHSSSGSNDVFAHSLNSLQARVTSMFEHMSSSYNDVNCKLDSILGKSAATSVVKGETAESIYISSLLREFPEAIVTDVSKTSHTCDIQIDRQPNQPCIFIELKNYTQPVPTVTVKKFENDMSHHANSGGIFASVSSAITGKSGFHIEIKGSNVLVFISNTGLVDVKCIRHAIQAIDILLDIINVHKDSDENEKKCVVQLDDEQCILIANEVRTYDQRQVQIIAALQHVISDIKAQTLSVVRRIILDRAVLTSTQNATETRCLVCNTSFKTISNLNRHLRNKTCSAKNEPALEAVSPEEDKLARKFFNDEMEISRGYGSVNSGLLKKQFEKWCVNTEQPVPKVDIKTLFDDILGPENWCVDGTCGRVYTEDQLRSWTGKVETVSDSPLHRINLRVHKGWRGYKLKNGISCEMKKVSNNGSTKANGDTVPACQ